MYLLVARGLSGSGGLPLDDGWIHQTLARNLAEFGQLVIVPGQPSAASTSPLWGLLLAVAYWAGLPPLLWAFALGVACLAGAAVLTHRLGELFGAPQAVRAGAGLLVLVEWRLLWGALSGMETLLFTALTLAALTEALTHDARRPWLLGLLLGLSGTARPEGLALAALLGVWLLARRRATVRELGVLAAAGCLPLLPVAWVNLQQYGSPLPATFFAKNAAYAGGFDPARYMTFAVDALGVLVRGPELLLLPGLLWLIAGWARRTDAQTGLLLAWAGGLTLAYALWLPALYHHGRYLFPLLPIAMVLGMHGSWLLLGRLHMPLVARAGVALLVVYTGYGWVRGAQEYAANIDLINRQQVWSAAWVRANAPAGAAIAAHDIGALAYFGGHPLIDMAGLATAELPAGPRDVSAVLALIRERSAAYALVIPAWYPPLYARLTSAGAEEVRAQPAAYVPEDQVLRILRLAKR